MRVPALRFPEFLEGKEWQEKQLYSVCQMKAGKFISASKINTQHIEGLYPCYGGNGLRGFTSEYSHSGEYSLIGRQGALCGNVNFVTGRFYATEHAIVVSPNKKINNNWLFYCLNKLNLNQYAIGQAQPGLSVNFLEKIVIQLPEQEKEQQKIANCLSSLDNIISVQRQKINALQKYKNGLMQKLFPAEGETVPELRFSQIQKEWSVDMFSSVFEIIDGDRGKNYPKSDELSNNGFCIFLNAKNVTKHGFRFEEMQFITEDKDRVLNKGKLQRLDVILTTRGTIGQFAFFSEEVPFEYMRINSGMVILRIKCSTIIASYLYYFCKSDIMSRHIQKSAFGNAQQQLTVAQIKSFIINYPSMHEQQKIVDCLSSLDELITAENQKLAALKTHKTGLMQQLFPSIDEVNA